MSYSGLSLEEFPVVDNVMLRSELEVLCADVNSAGYSIHPLEFQ